MFSTALKVILTQNCKNISALGDIVKYFILSK